jgi:hypothetical protein
VVQAEESTHDEYPAESGVCHGRYHLEANERKVVLSVDIAGSGWFVDRRTIVNGGLGFSLVPNHNTFLFSTLDSTSSISIAISITIATHIAWKFEESHNIQNR